MSDNVEPYWSRLTMWADGLESGLYKQTTGRLKRSYSSAGSFCCLGVACDLSRLGEWDNSAANSTWGQPVYHLKETPPHAIADFLSTDLFGGGRAVMNFYGIDDDFQGHIMAMNDADKASFKDIAEEVRKYRDEHYGKDRNRF